MVCINSYSTHEDTHNNECKFATVCRLSMLPVFATAARFLGSKLSRGLHGNLVARLTSSSPPPNEKRERIPFEINRRDGSWKNIQLMFQEFFRGSLNLLSQRDERVKNWIAKRTRLQDFKLQKVRLQKVSLFDKIRYWISICSNYTKQYQYTVLRKYCETNDWQ